MLTLKKYPKRSPHWQIRGTVQGVEVNRTTGTDSKREAEKLKTKIEKEIFDSVALGQKPPCTFADAVEVYIRRGGEIKYLPKLIEYFDGVFLKDIGQLEVDQAAQALYPNAKASTINRSCVNVIITVARAAFKAELPGAQLRPIERRKEVKPQITPATDDHIEKLLPHCSEGLAALITLMTYTGLRTGEALRVTKEDCRDGFIHVAKTKNGDARLTPIPHDWSYPEHGFGFTTTHGVGKSLRAAHKRAGLAYRDGHELGRHGFAARWLKSGGSIKGLKEAGGWKKLAVVDQSYGHLEITDVHATMRALSQKPRAKPVQS
jgi:integrase